MARKISSSVGMSEGQCQIALTPNWIGLLGWVNRFLSITFIFLVYRQFGLVWAIVLAGCIYLGLYALFSPIFEKLIETKGHVWMKQALNELKTSGGGYLAAYKLESAMAKERK